MGLLSGNGTLEDKVQFIYRIRGLKKALSTLLAALKFCEISSCYNHAPQFIDGEKSQEQSIYQLACAGLLLKIFGTDAP